MLVREERDVGNIAVKNFPHCGLLDYNRKHNRDLPSSSSTFAVRVGTAGPQHECAQNYHNNTYSREALLSFAAHVGDHLFMQSLNFCNVVIVLPVFPAAGESQQLLAHLSALAIIAKFEVQFGDFKTAPPNLVPYLPQVAEITTQTEQMVVRKELNQSHRRRITVQAAHWGTGQSRTILRASSRPFPHFC